MFDFLHKIRKFSVWLFKFLKRALVAYLSKYFVGLLQPTRPNHFNILVRSDAVANFFFRIFLLVFSGLLIFDFVATNNTSKFLMEKFTWYSRVGVENNLLQNVEESLALKIVLEFLLSQWGQMSLIYNNILLVQI